MKKVNNVNVLFNAACYALGQAEDCLDVVYKGASDDEELHFKQVKDLANIVTAMYMEASDEEVAANHWWDSRFVGIASCETLEEYKRRFQWRLIEGGKQ